jgi:hypothetical protein
LEPVAPTSAGIIARICWYVLRKALGQKKAEISESELVQVARVTVIGQGNLVTLHGPEREDAVDLPRDEMLRALVSECFQLVATQPGLSVVFGVGSGGERLIKIENPATYRVPAEAELLAAATFVPAPPPHALETKAAISSHNRPPVAERQSTTAKEYADYARKLVELPDSD